MSMVAASRARVIRAAATTSVPILTGGLLGHALIPSSFQPSLFPTSQTSILTGLASGTSVTLARFSLSKILPNFQQQQHESNTLTLSNTAPLDAPVVAILPALSEEAAFRGFFQPGITSLIGSHHAPARSVSIVSVALVFGVLHAGSGRRAEFVAWASAVGLLYGTISVRSVACIGDQKRCY
jgi:membrane protease YdiL (CAAX protease family)